MSIFSDNPELAKAIIKMESRRKVSLYRIKMLYNWYDTLMKVIPDIGEIERSSRYEEGSTVCIVDFYTKIHNENVLNDWLRTILKFDGWMELTKLA